MALFILMLCGCGEEEFKKSFVIEGTVNELSNSSNTIDVIEENEKMYEIPVEDTNVFEKGDSLRIVVYSNTSNDIWDLDHLRFDIEKNKK
ncbi:hypothetical protein [Terribacillus sp. DMT04]|uniref:hypothetical protein n=1 Tax=Terribacillus sp. DMT04 TaxID=2850441 RepID=UPI001C2BC9F9|nr:hypothetical protein [Terribacillus sp. DMT04]QXE02279.1 hypothetical protein KS242_03335 [Terribacillus sp. DMT04]